jgi:hypothetical protein
MTKGSGRVSPADNAALFRTQPKRLSGIFSREVRLSLTAEGNGRSVSQGVGVRLRWGAAVTGFTLVALFAAASAPAAKILRVCSSGCPYTTVQDAVAAASRGDTILTATGTYTGGLTIDKGITLTGAKADTTTLNLGGNQIIVTSEVTVTINNLTVTGGQTSFFSQAGGGINNAGKLTLNSDLISGNTANITGGGIFNSGDLTLINTTVTANTAAIGAGGIDNTGTATLANSTISNNSGGAGGGIENPGTMTLKDTTVSGNTALIGGGINNGGTLKLEHTTIRSNTASLLGGGLYNFGSSKLTNTTVSNNLAGIAGGGIDNQGLIALHHSTITANTPDNCLGC